MKRLVTCLMTLALAMSATLTYAQDDYPSRPIRIIVPLAAGGGTDVLARVIALKLATKLGQPVTVENRGGAAGNIGAEAVFRAPPDGYTLLFTQPAPLAVNKSLYGKLSFEPEQFVPISLVSLQDIMLAVNPAMPAKTVPELIAYAKANPGKLNYGSSGAGSAPHLAAELFKSMAKVDMVHVPYKGSAESMTATLGGQVDLTFFAFSSALPNAKAGKLRALAVGGSQRNAALPDVPTVADTLPGYLATSWTAFVAPPGTPPDIASKLQTAIAEVKKMPEVQNRMLEAGDQTFDTTPAQMAEFLKQETQRWDALIKSARITVQ
ncbi:MAG: tripartite tricarboxylate transporter substrate binding protein [Gammaproteobacteria bacterium]|nr:tripartite tricarboxylate transporter substrate binding protein [Gammaproteobacteria bacterium]MBU1443826.1 tripartite tricarboxylate transporter substrate binding protein [Gammaproteobacteria bacterium]